MTKTTTTSDVS